MLNISTTRKITYLSDLHTEFSPFSVSATDFGDSDYLVLAGDIGRGLEAYKTITQISENHPSLPIVLVLGNHELYGVGVSIYDAWRALLKNWPNIHLLQNQVETINGIKFIGTTLWTDLSSKSEANWAKQNITDYMRIPDWTAETCTGAHTLAVNFIEDELMSSTDNSNSIVVTHHVPTFRGIQSKYFDQYEKGHTSFATDLDYLIRACQPALWIYGHTHGSMDFLMGKTRLVCNPRGYPRMNKHENADFDPLKTIELKL